MKANDGSGNIPERDEWETPKKLFDILNDQYEFGFDCCATEKNFKAPYSKDFLKENCLDGYVCWMNPPFSKSFEMFKHFFEVVMYGIAIYRCDNFETKIYQDLILKKADWIFIPKGRVVYEGMNGKGARFPSCLIGVGVEYPKNIEGKLLRNK